MELSKKKYTVEEVKKILASTQFEYETKLNNQKDRISVLLEDNKRLAEQVKVFKEKDALISATLLTAKEKANEIEESSKLKYLLVLENLKKFSSDWKNYFEFLKEKYPNYATIQKSVKLKEALDDSLKTDNAEEIISKMGKKLSSVTEKIAITPKERVNNFIAVTSDSGFNIDEVLNPGKLELEDLCKELGLME